MWKKTPFDRQRFGDLFQRKDDPGFVVRPHHGNNRGVRPDGALQFSEIEAPLLIDLDDGDGAAAPNDRFAVVQNRVVLHGGGHDVPPIGRHLECGMERGVVRFRPSAGKDNFVGLATEQRRHPLVGQVGRFLHDRAKTMRARGIAVLRCQEWHHFLQDRGIDPRAGVVIEINDFGRGGHGMI